MAAKEPAVVCSSPFKFGFFAGLGFFFASALMSLVTGVCALIFVAFIGGMGAGVLANWHTTTTDHHQTRTTVAATDSQ